jgi:hypothetical protein
MHTYIIYGVILTEVEVSEEKYPMNRKFSLLFVVFINSILTYYALRSVMFKYILVYIYEERYLNDIQGIAK